MMSCMLAHGYVAIKHATDVCWCDLTGVFSPSTESGWEVEPGLCDSVFVHLVL